MKSVRTKLIAFDLFSFYIGSDRGDCNFKFCADSRKRCNDHDAAYRAEEDRRDQFHDSED